MIEGHDSCWSFKASLLESLILVGLDDLRPRNALSSSLMARGDELIGLDVLDVQMCCPT